jgi:hypothetical protein
LLHVVWISLAVWLVFECVETWQATKALAFAYKSLWGYLLMGVLGAAAVVAAWQYVPGRVRSILPSKAAVEAKRARLNRRHFVGLAALGIAGLVACVVFRCFRKESVSKAKRLQVSNFYPAISPDELIQNKRTNVIHFESCCNKHLPAAKNRLSSITPENVGVHGGCEVRIFAQLGAAAMIERERVQSQLRRAEYFLVPEDERDRVTLMLERLRLSGLTEGPLAVFCFNKAIALSPLSWHLYDRLARVYATLEQYSEIQPLFERGLSEVKQKMHKLAAAKKTPGTKRQLRVLVRAQEEFAARIERTKTRDKDFGDERRKPKDSGEQTTGNRKVT